MVEMTAFSNIPHLISPVVTETGRAAAILEWAMEKMDERYSLLAEARVKNVTGYNRLGAEEIVARFGPGSPEEEAKIPKTHFPNLISRTSKKRLNIEKQQRREETEKTIGIA